MAFLRSSRANPQSQAAQIPANHALNSESRPERHLCSQTITTDLPSGEPPKAPQAPSLSTGPLTPECTSQQQQPLSGLQTDPPTRGATSGEPSTAENLPISPPALESPSNGRSIMSVPSGGYHLAENSTKSPPMAEDSSTIPVDEVNSMGVPTPNPRPGRRLKTFLVAVARLSKLGSVAGETEHIIKDSTEEISDSDEPGEESKNEDIMNGRYECFVCEKYVKPVSFTRHCEICSRVRHLSCAAMEDWRCPTCHKNPLQNISDQLPEDKPRYPRSKRMFEEMNESITYDDDTDYDDEPPLKKHKSGIDTLIEPTKAEQVQTVQASRLREDGMKTNDRFRESWNQLSRRHACLADVPQFILDSEIQPFTSGPFYTHLFALDCMISQNGRQMKEVEQEFDHLHKGGMLDDQSEVLDKSSLLKTQHNNLREARRYILDFASSDRSPVRV